MGYTEVTPLRRVKLTSFAPARTKLRQDTAMLRTVKELRGIFLSSVTVTSRQADEVWGTKIQIWLSYCLRNNLFAQ
jgi:hypothetical protein